VNKTAYSVVIFYTLEIWLTYNSTRQNKVKSKAVHIHAIKGDRGHRVMDPLILNLCTKRR
jgi:hypothetical protein